MNRVDIFLDKDGGRRVVVNGVQVECAEVLVHGKSGSNAVTLVLPPSVVKVKGNVEKLEVKKPVPPVVAPEKAVVVPEVRINKPAEVK